jgi:hypothetical protein
MSLCRMSLHHLHIFLGIRVKRLNIKFSSQMESVGSLMLSSVSEEPHLNEI